MKVTAADGWELDVLRFPAQGAPIGVALLLHAMMADRRTWDRPRGSGFASTLAEAGFEVFAPDYRGHGASGPTPRDGGRWTYEDLVRLDTPALLDAARVAAPGLPVVMIGQSLGGHVTMAALGSGACPAPEAVVLLSTSPWIRSLAPGWRTRARRTATIAALRAVNRAAGRFPARRLRLGTSDEAGPYVRDLCRFWEQGWRSRDGFDYLSAMANVRMPLLAVFGASDAQLAPLDTARRWVEHAASPDLTVWVADVGDHGLTRAPGHMDLVTDPRSAPAWHAVIEWMEERCRASSSSRGT